MKQRVFSIIKRFTVLTAALSVLLFASCSNLVDMEKINLTPKKSEQEINPVQNIEIGQKVKISFSVAETARSAYPVVDCKSFNSFVLKCDGVVIEQWFKDAETGDSAYKMMMRKSSIEVDAGEHTFELTGSVASGTIYKDEVTQTVTEGSTLSFSLKLAKIPSSENGYFNWNITLPSSANSAAVRKITCALYATEDGATYSTTPTATTSSSVTYPFVYSSNSTLTEWNTTSYYYTFPAGIYVAVYSFYAYDGTNTYGEYLGSWEDIVGIIPSYTTTYVQTIPELNKTYTITYNLNGGSGNSSRYYSAQNDLTHQIPTKSNRIFAGWYTTSDFTGEPQTGWEAHSRIGDLSLYAKWNYSMVFNANDSEEAPAEGEMETLTQLEGITITIPTALFTREGYVFKGWSTSADGSGTFYQPGDSYPGTSNITLYAQWMERAEGEVSVTYFANGGTRVDMQVVDGGSTIAAPETSRTGYNLDGWYTSADAGQTLSDTAFEFGEDGDTVTEDIMLYAKWSPKVFTITYYDADATLTDKAFSGTHAVVYPAVHTYGRETVLDAPVAADSDETFTGWYTASDGTGTAVTSLGATDYAESVPALYAGYMQTKFHISADGDDTAGTGKADAPFATLSKAVAAITGLGRRADYTIVVHGEVLSNSYSLYIGTSYADSLTICGASGNDTDILDGNNSGTVLYIETSVPVTIKNLKITNGNTSRTYYGGGITLYSGNLTLAEGALITNNKSTYTFNTNYWSSYGYQYGGGGIFVMKGNLIMEEGAEISSNEANMSGGGVFLCGNGSDTTFTMNGGVIRDNTVLSDNNYSYSYNGGGGVYVYGYSSRTVFTMNGGEITGNSVPNATGSGNGGGGIYVYNNNNNAAFTMNGGTIHDNTCYGLGKNVRNAGTFNMTDGVVSDTDATSGVYNNGTLSMIGGDIAGTVLNAGSLYMSGGRTENIRQQSSLYMSGSASCGKVTLYSNCVLTINGELTGETPVAEIVPSSYTAGQKLITVSGETLTQELADKFALKDNGTPWSIIAEEDGAYLRRTVYSITYKDKNGEELSGTLDEDAALTHTYGTSTTLPIPEREGYAFQGWHKLPDCSDAAITRIAADEIRENITLYTYWTHEVVSFVINNSSLTITKTEAEDGTVTLTAADGYKAYMWDVDGESVGTVIAGASVSADGKMLTFNKSNIIKGMSYLISVTANNQNGLADHASVSVKKQEAE